MFSSFRIIERAPEWLDKYKLHTLIGTGSTATVHRATDEINDEDVAIKLYKKVYPRNYKNMASEISFGRLLNHLNIIEIKGFEIHESNSYVVMELGNLGNLEDFIKVHPLMPEAQVQNFTRQICSALIYMHNLNLYHGDLTMENIVVCGELDNVLLKIVDFGKTGIVTGTNISGSFASFPSSSTISMNFSNTTDVFNLGVIMYNMFYKKSPFAPSLMVAHYPFMKKIPQVKYPEDVKVSPEAMDLMMTCFDYEKRKMFTTQAFMNHPYLKDQLVRGVFFGDCFRTIGDIVTEAIDMIKQENLGFAMVDYTEALFLIKIKHEQSANYDIKTYIMSKIHEYTEIIHKLDKVMKGKLDKFPLDDNLGEWEKLRKIARASDIMQEALDMGFIGETLLRKGHFDSVKTVRNAVEKINNHLKLFHDPRIKYIYDLKIAQWMNVVEKYAEYDSD